MILAIFIFIGQLLACNYSLSLGNISTTWNGTNQQLAQTLVVTRGTDGDNNDCKRFFVTFSQGNSGNYTRYQQLGSYSDILAYNLYKDTAQSDILRDFNDVSNNRHVLIGKLNKEGDSESLEFYFYLPTPSTGATLRGGVYSDSINVRIFSGQWQNSSQFELAQTITINTFITKQVDISLVDTGGVLDINDTGQVIDFGTLETGENRGFDLRVRSNAGHMIYFSSQNNGKMKHSSRNEFINYSLQVNNVTKDLSSSSSSPVQVASGSGVSPIGGSLHQVKITIGSVSAKTEGLYQDFITVTAMTTE